MYLKHLDSQWQDTTSRHTKLIRRKVLTLRTRYYQCLVKIGTVNTGSNKVIGETIGTRIEVVDSIDHVM